MVNLRQAPAAGILTVAVLLPGTTIIGTVQGGASQGCGTMQLTPSNAPQMRTCTVLGGPLGGYTAIMRLSAVIAFEPSPGMNLARIRALEGRGALKLLCSRAGIVPVSLPKPYRRVDRLSFQRLVRAGGVETVCSHVTGMRAPVASTPPDAAAGYLRTHL